MKAIGFAIGVWLDWATRGFFFGLGLIIAWKVFG